jgi:hypothetical protein
MPKTKISEYSQTAASNTDIDGININEGCPPSTINNAIRELMAQIKDFQVGAAGDGLTVSTLNATTATLGAVEALSFGAITATSANVFGGISAGSANITGALTTDTANITTATIGAVLGTSATLSSPLPVASGGTGRATLTANNLLLGNGTTQVAFVAPSTSGNVLTSNGTTWSSAAPSVSSSSFTGANQSLDASGGYQKFPGGLTLQWGSVSVSGNTTTTFNFPIAFASACVFVKEAVVSTNVDTQDNHNATIVSASQFTISNGASATGTFKYFAVGY